MSLSICIGAHLSICPSPSPRLWLSVSALLYECASDSSHLRNSSLLSLRCSPRFILVGRWLISLYELVFYPSITSCLSPVLPSFMPRHPQPSWIKPRPPISLVASCAISHVKPQSSSTFFRVLLPSIHADSPSLILPWFAPCHNPLLHPAELVASRVVINH